MLALRLMVLASAALLLIGGLAVAWWAFAPGHSASPGTVVVKVPNLTPLARTGQISFDENCAGCHGEHAAGSLQGPPLVHRIYRPGHHADGAFLAAVQRGVRSHHWGYGNMPPQPQMTPEQTAAIVRYVRELQAANDIR
ncbi:MAG: cytochrome c [Alphaproteobacteria bacterium]|jgi:mono/diheme cytochrome c family protein|nr:cytochrome c [Alphaproteobacteria bacterium]MDP6624615.1 cytochrome c [Alphaproteobacteria bacterium]|tara:strand:- start:117 stop:533 length:417 start_codon:yes stop_codon:yes gene_type:complete